MPTPARMKSNSWPMLEPAPSPIRNSPGGKIQRRDGVGAGHGEGQHDCARHDDQDAEMEQIAAEAGDQREPGTHPGDHADDHCHQGQPGVDR